MKYFYLILQKAFLLILLSIFPHKAFPSSSEIFDQGVSVFMYHRFNESKFPSTNVSEKQLISHIKFIKENDFNILNIDQVINTINKGKTFSKKSIAFTVDDAYESFYSIAWPYFKENKIPVTLFVSTDSIDQKPGNYMSWEQIRNFVSEGGIVGQHTASHLHMPLNDISKVKDDIIKSQKIFLKELGYIPKHFAYPYGEASNQVIKLLSDFGINFAFGQHSGVISKESNKMYLPRFALNERYGEIDRFIFAAEVLPLAITDLIPDDMFLNNNSKPDIQFTILSNIKANQLTCFANTGGDWSEQKIKIVTEKKVSLSLDDQFKSGRGRLNCTSNNEDNWHWFGYQYIIK
tara:strand:- start:365 stop:1408 length:1044 start_codon:yes stop_codon:yes gene_type:complete